MKANELLTRRMIEILEKENVDPKEAMNQVNKEAHTKGTTLYELLSLYQDLEDVEIEAREGFEDTLFMDALNYSKIALNNVTLNNYCLPTMCLRSTGEIALENSSEVKMEYISL